MNPTKIIPPKELPMSELKAAERRLEAKEDAEESPPMVESEGSGSAKSDLRKSSSSGHVNGMVNGDHVNAQEDKDEINVTPLHERTGRDIRFGDLPHPRKHEREYSDGTSM
jgi:hypothetical protein